MNRDELILTDYMKRRFTDERLLWLLLHAKSGRLALSSCCCFIGVTTADHALRGEMEGRKAFAEPHYIRAHTADVMMIKNHPAELAFMRLGETDEVRREKLIPLINAEIARREEARSQIDASINELAVELVGA